MHIYELTIMAARERLDAGEISALDLTSECLQRIKRFNKKLHACLWIDEKGALEAAKAADQRIKKGERSPLLGIPFLAKDNIMTKGLKTTAASKMLKDYIAPYDATVIKKLKEAGAILLGKTNLDEFAHGSSTEYSAFGPTKNPWDVKRVPGGSSGGSAAAVAADMCLFALGTDTGGSVRHPASFCGVTGFKPSYGTCSRFGLIAMTSSTDVPGVLAKNPEDAGLVFNIIRGEDAKDQTTREYRSKKIDPAFSWKGKRIAVPKEYMEIPVAASVHSAFDKTIAFLKTAGAKIISVSLPLTPYAVAAYYVITPSEISSNLARFDGLRFGHTPKAAKNLEDYYVSSREEGFGPEVKRRIILGTFALSAGYVDAYYRQAQKVRSGICQEFENVFQKCDYVLTPATPTAAFAFGAKKNPLAMYLEDVFSVPASLAGLPAVVIPAAKKPLPIGLQLIGALGDDDGVLGAAGELEKIFACSDIKPKL